MAASHIDWIGGAALALALIVLPTVPLAQTKPPAAAPPSPEVQAALKQAETGDIEPLVKLADGGDPDAQYHAGELFLFGGGSITRDGVRGCAYEEKASVRRADAMHLVGMCYQSGAGGVQDKAKAETAFLAAAGMGFPKSKCTLGQMLMADPKEAQRGLSLCKESANAGDASAQEVVGNAYFTGVTGKANPTEARKWYEKAARQNNTNAARRLGEMWVRGDGGRKDPKKALELWTAAEKAGDPLVAILVADQMFSDLTGGKKPGPGTFAFRGGIPTANIEVVEQWYQLAQERDPRPEVKDRAKYALSILGSFKTAATGAAAGVSASGNR